MNRVRAAALAAAALLGLAAPSARAEMILQSGLYGYANRVPGLAAHDAQTGGIALGTTLVDINGQPITNSNPLAVNATVTGSNFSQGAAGDPTAGWYIRPGTGSNLATETGNLQALALGLGAPATGPYSGSGDATLLSALKGLYGRSDAAATTLGLPGDAAWSGSGSGSAIAVQKRLASLLAQTATDTGLAPVGSSAVESAHVLKASGGQLFGFQVNFLACSQPTCWVLLLDTASAPGNGAVTPKKWYQVGTNSTLTASWPPGPPLRFTSGITIACSSTGPFTFTATAQCAISGEVQ